MFEKIWCNYLGPALLFIVILVSFFCLIFAICCGIAVDSFHVCSGFTHFFEGSFFCPSCGVQLRELPVYCDACEAKVYGNFCDVCGAAVSHR